MQFFDLNPYTFFQPVCFLDILQIVTVNCARIIHGNQIATNGVVHVIDRVVTAVGNTIEDFIDAEDDLSSLRVSIFLNMHNVLHNYMYYARC